MRALKAYELHQNGSRRALNPGSALSSCGSGILVARILNNCAEGSAIQRTIQDELLSRTQSAIHADSKTPWLFSNEELKAMRKKWGRKAGSRRIEN